MRCGPRLDVMRACMMSHAQHGASTQHAHACMMRVCPTLPIMVVNKSPCHGQSQLDGMHYCPHALRAMTSGMEVGRVIGCCLPSKVTSVMRRGLSFFCR